MINILSLNFIKYKTLINKIFKNYNSGFEPSQTTIEKSEYFNITYSNHLTKSY